MQLAKKTVHTFAMRTNLICSDLQGPATATYSVLSDRMLPKAPARYKIIVIQISTRHDTPKALHLHYDNFA